jgi:chromosome segregation ATPase
MDINEYLDSLAADGSMSAEDRTAMAAIMGKNPKAAERATKGYLLQSDYTKKTQEIATERQRLAAEQNALSGQLTKALKDLENNKITAAQYRAKLESINSEWGDTVIDLKSLGDPAPVSTPVQQVAQTDPALLARLEAAERNYGVSPRIAARIADAQLEYQRVFGNLDNFSAEKLIDYAEQNKIALRSDPVNGGRGAFEELYKVADKRRELEIAKITADANKAADDRVQKRIDELSVNGVTGEQAPNWATGSNVLSKQFRDSQADRIKAGGGDPAILERGASQSRSAAESELGGAGAAFAQKFMQRRAQGVPLGQEAKAAA